MLTGKQPESVVAEISYLQPDNRLKDRKILITGGTRGIGKAIARKFVNEGAKVVLTGRTEQVASEVAMSIGASHITMDMTDIESIDAILSKADEIMGGLDGVISNAGISLHEGNILNVSEENFDQQFDVNLRGAYFLSQRFIAYQKAKGIKTSDILFVSSERGDYADDLPYGLTKNALNCLVRGLAARFAEDGIRVNAIAPGVTATEMTGIREDSDLYVGYNSTKRAYLPDEMAEIACFMMSRASSCISGQILVCNQAKSVNPHWK